MSKRDAYNTTDTVHAMLNDLGSNLTQDEKAQMASFILQAIDMYEPLRRVDKALAGREILITIDHAIERRKGEPGSGSKNITCQSGCSHCCNIPVTCTIPEATVALMVAEAKGFVIDEAKLERQSKVKNEDWFNQPREDWACIFLRDGLCGIYEGRTVSCRKHFSQGPPEGCDMDKHQPGETMARWIAPTAEGLYSGVMNVFKIGMLAKVLLLARGFRDQAKIVPKES